MQQKNSANCSKSKIDPQDWLKSDFKWKRRISALRIVSRVRYGKKIREGVKWDLTFYQRGRKVRSDSSRHRRNVNFEKRDLVFDLVKMPGPSKTTSSKFFQNEIW